LTAFSLSGGQAHDAPEGERLLDEIERLTEQFYIIMDRAYEGDGMRAKVSSIAASSLSIAKPRLIESI